MDRMGWMYSALAVLAGCAIAFQPAANSTLAGRCTHPLQASIISFGTGLLALCVVGLIMRIGTPQISRLADMPLWAWCGGLLGTYMVTVALLAVPKLGAANWVALVIAGQVILSLVMDHFGWAGLGAHPLTWLRMLGAALLAAGVFLVMRF